MGVISKPRSTRSFPPHALTVEQILADLDSAELFDPFDPFSFSPCSQPSPSHITGTPISTPDPTFSYTTWLQAHSQMMPSAGAGAPPPPQPPNNSNAPFTACESSTKSSGKSPASSTPTSSSSPTRRPRKKPRRESSVRFQCPKCPSTFSRKDNLATHARVHTGERPYTCRFCARTFMWPSSARTHELTHQRNQKKNQNKATASQSHVIPRAQPAVARRQNSAQETVPQAQRQVQGIPQVQPSFEQPLSQAQRAEHLSIPPQVPSLQVHASMQRPQSQFSSSPSMGPLDMPFSTSPVTRDVKSEAVLNQPLSFPVQPRSSDAQQSQRSHVHHSQQQPPMTSSGWSSQQETIDAIARSVVLGADMQASAPDAHRASMEFPLQQTVGQTVSGSGATVAEIDPVHAGVLATIEGLIGDASQTGNDGASVVGQTHVGVSEGVNPTFGAHVAGMSQKELERHMEAIFPTNDAQGNTHRNGDGDGDGDGGGHV